MTAHSRNKGHGFERRLSKKFKELGFDCTTSRLSSRAMDFAGVDLCGLPINLQAKAVERLSPSYHDILKSMPSSGPNVIAHKRNNKGTVFVVTEEFFFELFKKYYEC